MFKEIIEKTLKNEGGYVNHASDRGGETYKGIARKFWPQWTGWSIIDRMERGKYTSDKAFTTALDANSELHQLVLDFYKKNFWDKMRLDEVKNDKIKYLMSDFGINFGTSRAVKYAQICSGSKVDSLIGPNTIQAINKTEPNKFCYQFLMECVEGYVSLVNRDDSQRAFLLGWMRRVVGAYYQVRE